MTPHSIDIEAIEAVARFEFDRLERGDLRVKGGPLPWEKCEPGLREEMLDWAREALEAAAPHLQVAEKEDRQSRLASSPSPPQAEDSDAGSVDRSAGLSGEDIARLELIRDHDGNDLSENDKALLTRLAEQG